MAKQISSLTRLPTVSSARAASSIVPPADSVPNPVEPPTATIKETPPTTSSPTTSSPSSSPSTASEIYPPPDEERQSRDLTRRRDLIQPARQSTYLPRNARPVSQPARPLRQEMPWNPRQAPAPDTPSAPIIATDTPSAPIIAYTDASCVQDRASGIGIFFGDGHPLNTSKALAGPEHNSGIGEIIAAQTALAKILEWKDYKGQPVIIRTDYMGVIDAMNNGNFGRFSGLYADLRRMAERFPSVTFEHVYGHDGERGNEMADSLARDAIRLRRRSASPFAKAGERSRSRDRGRRSRSATIKGRRDRKKSSSPVKVSDTSKVPPVDKSRSRSRDRKRSKSRGEVIKGVTGGRRSPTRSVRSMQRSERANQARRQAKMSGKSASRGGNGGRGGRR